jgi:hypothetical protein
MLWQPVNAAADFWSFLRPAAPKAPLQLRLDTAGPYVILATQRSTAAYASAIKLALELHPASERIDFDPQNLDSLLNTLKRIQPRYGLVFIQPEELEVNFVWRWLAMTSQIDDDPFVDVRIGFITGATPEAAQVFVSRIAEIGSGRLRIPGACIDNLGPSEQGSSRTFSVFSGAMMLPLAPEAPFNDRALVEFQLPEEWNSVSGVEVSNITSHGMPMPHRLIGHAAERDNKILRLHVQIGVPAQGFQQSRLRAGGARVEIVVKR